MRSLALPPATALGGSPQAENSLQSMTPTPAPQGPGRVQLSLYRWHTGGGGRAWLRESEAEAL